MVLYFFICRKYTFKSKSSVALYVDSDSEDEPLKRSVAHSQRLCDVQSREQQQQQEEAEKVTDSFLSMGLTIRVHFLLLRGENMSLQT